METLDYLKKIAKEEDLHGKISDEETRRVLLKYFNNYTFKDEIDMARFFAVFEVINYNTYLQFMKYVRWDVVAEDFSNKYNFVANIKNRKLTIQDIPINTYKEGEKDDPFGVA